MKRKLRFSEPFRFEIRVDGLYRQTAFGEWRRILKATELAVIAHALERFTHENDRLERGRDSLGPFGKPGRPTRCGLARTLKAEKAAQIDRLAISRIRRNLRDRDGIIDLQSDGAEARNRERLNSANGFIVDGRERRSMFAIKPDAMRSWAGKDCRFQRVLAAFDEHGWLVRGADGKTTRQVQIPGLGRRRYYCLALAASKKPDSEPGPEPQSLTSQLTDERNRASPCPAQPNPDLPNPQPFRESGDHWQAGAETRAVGLLQNRSGLPRKARRKGRGRTAWEDDPDEDSAPEE